MKRIIVLSVIAILGIGNISAQDWNKFSFKGKVLESKITSGYSDLGSYTFSEKGALKSMDLEMAGNYTLRINNIQATAKGFTGNFNNGTKVSINYSNGRLTSANFSYEDKNYSINYTYGANGFLSKIAEKTNWTTYSETWVDATASVKTNNKDVYQKKYMEALKAGKTQEAAKYKKLYDDAVKNATVNTTKGYSKKVAENHSESYVATYSDYKMDEHGNWISRVKKREDETSGRNQNQSLTYEPEYLSEFHWNKLKPTGDLNAIEAFALEETTTANYKKIASDFWNQKVQSDIVSSKDATADQLCYVASSPIVNEANRSAALNAARKDIYENTVLRERDYKKVANYANYKVRQYPIFDQEYRKMIGDYSQKLKNDSVANLLAWADQGLQSQNYDKAGAYARQALQIAPGNTQAMEKRAEAEYNQLKHKAAINTITEQDYAQFLEDNPNSKYTQEVNNARALLAASLFNKSTTDEEMERVKSLPMDEKTSKTVTGMAKHQYYLNHRGRFFNIGLAVDGAAGPGILEYGGGIGIRLGWRRSLLNLYTGAEYDLIDYVKFYEKIDKGGVFSGSRITIPIEARLNFVHKYDHDFFLGAGVNINFALKARYSYADTNGDKVHSPRDKNLMVSPSFSPRFGLGYAGEMFEFEVYGLYEVNDVFDATYINSLAITPLMNPKAYDKQLSNKFRFGMALRLLF